MVMKIFFPVEVFYPSQAGGPANTVYWITKNLLKHGIQPVIVATDKGIRNHPALNQWLETDGGKAIYIRTFFLHFPFYQTVISFLTFFRADIVHLSSFFFPTAFLTAFAAYFLKKKIVWSARGELDTKALAHSSLRKRPILWCIKKIIGRYPVFHSTCDEETQYIKNIFGESARIAQIPNYIEIPEPLERSPADYLLYLGRIHPKKAIDNLIRALSISDEFMNSKYILKIAGTGKREFCRNLEKLVDELNLNEKIKFVGQIEGTEKQQMLADAFWTIMPSHTENFGIVVLESLAQSTPVIASTGSPWNSLNEHQIGFWTDNAPEQLALVINEILRMPPSCYEEYRRRCRGFVESEFDIANNIDKWISLYRSLSNAGGPSFYDPSGQVKEANLSNSKV